MSARRNPVFGRARFAGAVGVLLSVTLAAAVPLAGCRSRDAGGADAAVPSNAAPAAVAEPEGRPRIVALGDSLTAGYGLTSGDSYPALLQRRVDEAGYPFEVVNMGVSGDTSAGGLSRLDWALEGDVRVLILALGGNDGLRGLPPPSLAKNLEAIVDRARARGVAVLLCGMETPPNFGASYTSEFRDVYRRLAREKEVTFLPFLLDGVAGDRALNQADGIHPNQAGTRRVADLVWGRLEPMLAAITAS